MAVQVSSKALVRQWGLHDHESIVVAFRGAEGPGSAYIALSRAITSANHAATSQWLSRGVQAVIGGDPADTPQGPVSHVAVYTDDALMAWVDHVAAQLSGEGWTGTLRPATRRHSPLQLHRKPLEAISAVLCIAGWGMREGRPRPQAHGAWRGNPSVSEELASWANDWTVSGPGATYLTQHMTTFKVGAADLPQLLATALTRDARGAISITHCRTTNWARRVNFDRSGRIEVEIRTSENNGQSPLDDLRAVLTHHAQRCEYALVRQAWMQAITSLGVIQRRPPRLAGSATGMSPNSYYRERRHLDTVRVPDAYGIQLLTEEHLRHLRNPDSWSVKEVAPGRHLVEALDVSPWFADSEVSPSILTASRDDFRDLILTEEPPLHG